MSKTVKIFVCRFCRVHLANHTEEQINAHIAIKHPRPKRKPLHFSVALTKTERKRRKKEARKRFEKEKDAHRELLIRPEGMIAKEFYKSAVWMHLRYQVLKKQGRKCSLCETTDGPFHVDHIKPRSMFPDLQFEESNLQVLCRSCNLGKSNLDETDWRKT